MKNAKYISLHKKFKILSQILNLFKNEVHPFLHSFQRRQVGFEKSVRCPNWTKAFLNGLFSRNENPNIYFYVKCLCMILWGPFSAFRCVVRPLGDIGARHLVAGAATNGLIFKYAPTAVKKFLLSIFRFAPVLLKLINNEEPLSLYR